jgi:hypothetical protein
MNHIISLGAINKSTGEYVYPKIANKKDEYVCPECNKDLILCQGEIMVHHFRHKVDSVNPCNHYNNPGESQIHKDAKLVLKSLLERKKPISFVRNCASCRKNEEFEIPEISETSNILLEHRFEYNGPKIADVAYIDNNELVCILEICNTHKTARENRPEPWFEINALTLIKTANDTSLSQIQIPCVRCEKCEDCVEIIKNELIQKEINIKTAISSLTRWIRDGKRVEPFVFKNFDGIYECGDEGVLHTDNYKPDIIAYDKCNISIIRYYIDVTQKFYSSEFKKECDGSGIGLYYVDMNWILKQKTKPIWLINLLIEPVKIDCVKITDIYSEEHHNKEPYIEEHLRFFTNPKNTRKITSGIDNNKFVYLNVDFSKKNMIKEYGGKWNKQNKLWYISKSVYNINKNYIDEFIGSKIDWIGGGVVSAVGGDCPSCGGFGVVEGDPCWFC